MAGPRATASQALRLKTDYAAAHNNYAILLSEMGRTEEAEYYRREAERLREEENKPERARRGGL